MSLTELNREYETITQKLDKIHDENVDSIIQRMIGVDSNSDNADFKEICTILLCYRVYVGVKLWNTRLLV